MSKSAVNIQETNTSEKKKILILGGNTAQIPLITAARREGYFVVLCDYTTTNPGISLADKHYQENFTDRDKVLEIARLENVHGVISNSEASVPVMAYVSEMMGLIGNSVESVSKLNSKMDFRELQDKVGVYSPKHVITASFKEALKAAKSLSFPIIIKPCKSSGSRGTEKIEDYQSLMNHQQEWMMCSLYSLDKKVVLEEFVEMSGLDNIIDGDIFVLDDTIIWNGLFSSKRSEWAPMLPMTQTYPIILNDDELEEVKDNVSRLLKGAGIRFGEYNIELYYSDRHKLFCIEINARQGGNGIPEMVHKHSGIDMHKLLVTSAMGDFAYFHQVLEEEHTCRFVSRHPVFSRINGRYQGVEISAEIHPFVKDIQNLAEIGQEVKRGQMARDKIALVDLEFDTREQQLYFVKQIEEHIIPIIDVTS